MTLPWRSLLLLCALCGLSGCERQVRSMYQQARYDPGEASTLFADGKAARPPPPGSVAAASGDLAGTSSGRRGRDVVAQSTAAYAATAPQITPALLRRGRERDEAPDGSVGRSAAADTMTSTISSSADCSTIR